jgi:hypothetical protein
LNFGSDSGSVFFEGFTIMTLALFEAPYAKLRGAKRHGDFFKQELNRYVDSHKNSAITWEQVSPSADRILYAELRPIPPDLSVMLGDIAYQLRSTLDVLTCDLARWSGHNDVKRVYFPIARTEEFYRTKDTQDKIEKLKPELRAIFDEIKPYGDSILVKLNALANTDKHQTLLTVVPSIDDIDWSAFGSGNLPERLDLTYRRPAPMTPNRTPFLRVPANSPIEGIDAKLHFKVFFTTEPIVGEEVIPTLTAMGRAVQAVVRRFQAHCGPQDGGARSLEGQKA